MTEPRRTLVVLIRGHLVGVIDERGAGQLSLNYDDGWRSRDDATPLSLSMPLRRRAHPDATVRAFLWGLLPDNERVLERWARAYQVSARSPFALLRHVGEDCAGAAQFVRPDRVDALAAGAGGVDGIDDIEIAERIRILRRDPAAWHVAESGQFSLAGAQAKTALHADPASGRWGDPWGTIPTTHILKPAVTGFDDHDLNEHLCLAAARRLGLPAARSRLALFISERVIVVTRYDRSYQPDGTIIRVHQEDLCQALGLSPLTKYQNEGGPSPEHIINLLRREVTPASAAELAIMRFVDALAFNWLIGGTDAHAKNYSILLDGHRVRLAPLYDVSSVLPYDDMYLPKMRMAMRIGGEYRLEGIIGRHWRRLAAENGLDPDEIVARIDDLALRAPAAFAAVADDPAVRGLASDLPARLADRVRARASRCRRALTDG